MSVTANVKDFLMRMWEGWILFKLPGNLTCKEAGEFMDGYLDGTLDAETKARFEKHLGMCPLCEQYLEDYRRSITLTRDALAYDSVAAEEVLPDDLVSAIMDARHSA